MKPELKALKAVLAENAADLAFLNSFHGRVNEAYAHAAKLHNALADDPNETNALALIAAQTRAEALLKPCDRAREAVVMPIMTRIGDRSRGPIKDALIASVEVLKAELETFYDENRRRCEQLGISFEEFSQISPIRKRLESEINGLEVSIPRIDSITPNEVTVYAKLALDVLEK
jgi:hypothetical protein